MPILNRGSRARLQHCLETEREAILKTLRYYVFRAGLANGSEARAAEELFNEMAIEAFKSVHRLTDDILPKRWLLGIAANLIKRKQADAAKRQRREPLMRDLFPQTEESLSDEELFDLLPVVTDPSLANWEMNEHITQLLSYLSQSESDLLRLAILHDLNGDELAKELGVSPGAARMRLHRALNRLRALYLQPAEDAHE
jgi:RNA polymerase sigma-70 factor (ECF subfamily)